MVTMALSENSDFSIQDIQGRFEGEHEELNNGCDSCGDQTNWPQAWNVIHVVMEQFWVPSCG